jgi:DsbC/DsbD-like thiol-disulfide interchange protein
VPVRFNQPGDIVGYGYTGSVLLSAKVKAPRKLSPGSTVVIRAKVSWLGCEKVCIPGQATLDLKLPVGPSATPANRELFAAWEKRLPVDADAANSPLTPNIVGDIPTDASPATFTVLLQWKLPPAHVEWFPTSDEALNIENVTCKTEGNETHIKFTAAILPGQRLSSDVLETLVVYTDANGERKGVSVPVRLRESANRRKR